jgi:excisionase family DNA binding protein
MKVRQDIVYARVSNIDGICWSPRTRPPLECQARSCFQGLRLHKKEDELKATQHKRRPVRTVPARSGFSPVMTIREAAAFLHCHTSTLYRLAKSGRIPAFRLGGSWRFTLEALENWMRKTSE